MAKQNKSTDYKTLPRTNWGELRANYLAGISTSSQITVDMIDQTTRATKSLDRIIANINGQTNRSSEYKKQDPITSSYSTTSSLEGPAA